MWKSFADADLIECLLWSWYGVLWVLLLTGNFPLFMEWVLR